MRGSECEWVAAYERPVPLFPLFLFPGGELAPLGTRRGLLPRIETIDPRSLPRSELPEIPKVLDALRNANLLPAIFFLKSRADCDRAVSFCRPAQDPRPAGRCPEISGDGSMNCSMMYPFLRTHQHLSILKSCRVGSHHGGQLPHWKLFSGKDDAGQDIWTPSSRPPRSQRGSISRRERLLFFKATGSTARNSCRLGATDLLQMTGRAGRRGMDEIGFVLVVPGAASGPASL